MILLNLPIAFFRYLGQFFDGLGAVVNSARGVLFPFKPDDVDWERKVAAAAREAATALALPR